MRLAGVCLLEILTEDKKSSRDVYKLMNFEIFFSSFSVQAWIKSSEIPYKVYKIYRSQNLKTVLLTLELFQEFFFVIIFLKQFVDLQIIKSL